MVYEFFISIGDIDINNIFYTEKYIGGDVKVWGGGSFIWDEVFNFCLVFEIDELVFFF